MATKGILVRLREDFAAWLATDTASGAAAYFSPEGGIAIPVFHKQPKTVAQKIQDGLTKSGFAITVQTVKGGKAVNNVPGKRGYEEVILGAMVTCVPNANPSGLDVETVADAVVHFARSYAFEPYSGATKITPQHTGSYLVETPAGDPAVHWGVFFKLANVFTSEVPAR